MPSHQPERRAPPRTPEANEGSAPACIGPRRPLSKPNWPSGRVSVSWPPTTRRCRSRRLSWRCAPVRPSRGQRSRPRNAWRMVADVAPELGEWAGFFAATEAKRDAVRAGAQFDRQQPARPTTWCGTRGRSSAWSSGWSASRRDGVRPRGREPNA